MRVEHRTPQIIHHLFHTSIASQVPYTSLDRPTSQRIWPVFHGLYERSSDLQLTSAYGLFRRMTGVDGRPEVVLEGANNLEGPWIEYEFPYKPGNVARAPPFVGRFELFLTFSFHVF